MKPSVQQEIQKPKKIKSDWQSLKQKYNNIRRFENTGLDEESLKEITQREIVRLTEKLDPVAQKDFESISPRAKKILFNHGSLLLQKYEPSLHESLYRRRMNATQSQILKENQENIQRLRMPVLKL